ncbi:MAG: BACON domain-containing protein [Porphyromonadaceae bacterium]|nr:BACON domain-containing protein [Porphyromonadaceae bacterium]
MKKTNLFNRTLWSMLVAVSLVLGFSCTQDNKSQEPLMLSADRLALDFAAEGGSEIIKITTNVAAWVATAPQEGVWVELSQTKDELKIEVAPNMQAKVRTSYILVQAGETTPVKIKLTQAAGTSQVKQARKFVMPLLEEKPTGAQVTRYEVAQNSVLKSYLEASPTYNAPDDLYFFFSESEMFPEVLYAIRQKTKSLIEVSTLCSNYDLAEAERQSMINFYKDNDFEILSEEAMLIQGRHKTKPFNLKITYSEGKGVIVSFEQYARQSKAYSTFAAMPGFPQEYFENQAWQFDQIRDAELKAGSREEQHTPVSAGANKGKIALATFTSAANKKPLISVGYYFHWESGAKPEHLGTVKEIAALYDDVSLGFWEDTDITGAYIPTNEFNRLLEKNGWSFVSIENGYYGYFQSKTKMMLACKAAKIRGINNNDPCVQINFFPAPDYVAGTTAPKQSAHRFDAIVALFNRAVQIR